MDTADRCRQDQHCVAKERLQDRVTGEHLGWAGVTLTGMDAALPGMRGPDGGWVERDPVPGSLTGLCPGCITTVDQALLRIPGDVAELHLLWASPLTGSSAESGQITRPDPGPAAPLQAHLFALAELLDHEVCSWASATAKSIGLEWSRDTERHQRIGARVDAGTQLLRFRLGAFLALPSTRYRARSLTARRADGHDLEACIVRGDDIYDTSRDGVAGALVLAGLHNLVWVFGQHHQAPDRLHLPCRHVQCCRTALIHWPGEQDVACTACGAITKFDDYDELRQRFLAA